MADAKSTGQPTGPTRREILKAGAAGAGLISLGLPMLTGCGQGDSVPDSYRFDIAEAVAIDPALITWEQIEERDLGLINASDAVMLDSILAVAHEQSVQLHGLATGETQTLPMPGQVTALAAEGKRLLVALKSRVQLWEEGAISDAWPDLGEQAYITSITKAGDDLYIADAGRRKVRRYRAHDLVWELDDFLVPSPYFDLAFQNDLLWVANSGKHAVEAYDSAGELKQSFGSTGMKLDQFCGCCNPCHFLMLSDGRFVTAEKGLHRVKVLKPDGSLDGAVAGAEHFGISVNKPLPISPEKNGPPGPIPMLHVNDQLVVLHPITGKLHIFKEKA